MLYRLSVLLRCVSILRGVQETEIHGDSGLPDVCTLFQKDFRGSDMDLDLNALLGVQVHSGVFFTVQ